MPTNSDLAQSGTPAGSRMRSQPEWVSDLAAEALHLLGCRFVTMTPGSSFRGLHDSLVNHGGDESPKMVMCLNEQIAVSAAHAYAKATNDVAVVLLHDVVGLLHAQVSLFNAWCDWAPIVVIGGSGPRDPGKRRPIDWLHSADAQVELVRPFTKFVDEPIRSDDVVDAIAAAARSARTAPQGPVYVALDQALQESPCDSGSVQDALHSLGKRTAAASEPSPDSEVIAEVARWLLDAELPVLVPGRVGLDPTATPLVVELAECLGAACFDERNFVTTPTTHPLNLTGDPDVIAEADVLFLLEPNDARALLERAGPCSGRLISAGLSHLAAAGWTNGRRGQPVPDLLLPSTGRVAVDAVLTEVQRQLADGAGQAAISREDRRRDIAARHATLRTEQRAKVAPSELEEQGSTISTTQLIDEVHRIVTEHPYLLAIRHPYSWPEGIWEFDRAGQFLGGSGGGGLGYGPAALLGAAMAATPGQVTVGIIGDGDWLMNPAVLWTAVHHAFPFLAIILDNRAFGNDLRHQRTIARARGRASERAVIGTAIDDPPVDLVAQARSFGAWAYGPVVAREELQHQLRRGVDEVKSGRVAVLPVLTNET